MGEDAHVTSDCNYHRLLTYSRYGNFELPAHGILALHHCYADNYKDADDADQSLSTGRAQDNLPYGGSGPARGNLRAQDSTLRWFDGVRACTAALPRAPCMAPAVWGGLRAS